MCARYTLRQKASAIATLFDVDHVPDLAPRYNIAPTQALAAIRQGERGREFAWLRWGLIPSWAKDPKIGSTLLNARAETLADKPAYRAAFRRRRCLIPADGYYEWLARGKKKLPFHFHLRGGEPFAFAGLWEHRKADEAAVETCTIVTTAGNELTREIHDRMPVILRPADYAEWLDPEEPDPRRLLALLKPYDAEAMACVQVDPIVNNARNDVPECLRPAKDDDLFAGQ